MTSLNPVVYEVRVKPLAGVGERFLRWMREEHADDLLSINGCKECRVLASRTDEYVCQYLFDSQNHLDAYLLNDAETMRDKASAHFEAGELVIERYTYSALLLKNS